MTTTKKLEKILNKTENELTKYVINDILEAGNNEEVECYMQDVMRGGCVSGTVSSLIYYYDTKNFYIKYMDEIHELYVETCESIGEDVKIDTSNISNWFAWFGYEETMHNLVSELDIEY